LKKAEGRGTGRIKVGGNLRPQPLVLNPKRDKVEDQQTFCSGDTFPPFDGGKARAASALKLLPLRAKPDKPGAKSGAYL
jgi:hypothetical protein